MKKFILSTIMAMILMFSAYGMAADNDEYPTSNDSLSIDNTVSGNMRANFQQVIYIAGQQFFNSNMAQMPGSGQNNMQTLRNMQGAPQNMRSGNMMNNAPSNMPSQNTLMQTVPRMQQEMLDREELMDFLNDSTFTVEDVSEFQEYVTPYADAVQDYLVDEDLDDAEEIYEEAVSWTWVSDTTLCGQQEAWLTPTEFLDETPDYDSNPVSGEVVGDCEDQANALASLLIGSGEYNESTVRVAVGLVDFGGSIGGHAWVEIYEDGEWFPVDPTVGPYYDDDLEEVVYPDDYEDVDLHYFQDEDYSVMELWYYYNNEYFMDLSSGTEDAPDNWDFTPSNYR